MGLFGKIKEAKSSSGGIYFVPGSFDLECRANKSSITRDGRAFFVAEFTILSSTSPDRPVGTVMSWMVMLDKNLETGLGNIKQYVSSLYGLAEHEVDEAGVEALVAADNPGAGIKIRASATNITTRKGTPFTKVIFSHLK